MGCALFLLEFAWRLAWRDGRLLELRIDGDRLRALLVTQRPASWPLVFAVDASGTVQQIGSYSGPGGADEVTIAPGGFGSAAGDALLTVDAGASGGTLVAIDPSGKTRAIATFSDGPNPVVPIPKTAARAGKAPRGVYLTDDQTQDVYFLPASQLVPFAGDVLVGSESKAHFWIVEPRGQKFVAVAVRHNLRGGHYSLEGATFVG